MRATAKRTVMKLSVKWRSGRVMERVGVQRPGGRGGKMPHTFGDDERIAAQDNRDVVMPTGKASAFEVIEAELALEVFVGTFSSPALHDDFDQLLLVPPCRQRRQEVVGWFGLAIAPLDQEPQRFALGRRRAVIVSGHDPHACEAGRQVFFGPLAPSAATKASAGLDLEREIAHLHS
jgi:hypothetical protein